MKPEHGARILALVYVGTIFGGSMYGAVDPIYMVMLIKGLGPDYVVWDKAATIRFRRPGREPLYATFLLPPDLLATLRAEADRTGKIEKEFVVELVSASGEVHASCQKLLSIRRRQSADAAPSRGHHLQRRASERPGPDR